MKKIFVMVMALTMGVAFTGCNTITDEDDGMYFPPVENNNDDGNKAPVCDFAEVIRQNEEYIESEKDLYNWYVNKPTYYDGEEEKMAVIKTGLDDFENNHNIYVCGNPYGDCKMWVCGAASDYEMSLVKHTHTFKYKDYTIKFYISVMAR